MNIVNIQTEIVDQWSYVDDLGIFWKQSLLTTVVKAVAIVVVQHALLQWPLSNLGYNKISGRACHMI